MEKYNGQSGVFKVKEYPNMLAFVGGDKNNESEVSIGTLNVTIDGRKEVGLHFVKCNRKGVVNEQIDDFENTIDNNEQSFIFIPHSKDAIDFLIGYLHDLKNNF